MDTFASSSYDLSLFLAQHGSCVIYYHYLSKMKITWQEFLWDVQCYTMNLGSIFTLIQAQRDLRGPVEKY